jgi:hypothetical protein
VVQVFDETHRVFDPRVTSLTEDHRWQFMLTVMVTGKLEDEFEVGRPRV